MRGRQKCGDLEDQETYPEPGSGERVRACVCARVRVSLCVSVY